MTALTRNKKKKKPIKVASRKDKARNLQKRVASKIGELLDLDDSEVGYDEDCIIKPAKMGESGVDVKIDKSIRNKFPYAVECKSTENWNLPAAIRQVKQYVGNGYTDWVVFLKKKEFQETVAVVNIKLLFELLGCKKVVNDFEEEVKCFKP